MRPLPPDVPPWPLWTAAVAVAGTWVVGLLAAFVATLAISLAGSDELTPAAVLLLSLLTAGGSLALVAGLARGTAPPLPEHFGVRPAPARLVVAGLAFAGGVVALGAVVAGAIADPFAQPSIPIELSEQSRLERTLGEPDVTLVAVDTGTMVSLAARAVIGVTAGEIVLRGFVFPALAARLGLGLATAIVAVLFGGVGAAVSGDGGLVVPAVALGAVLCLLYAETGSIVPGVGLAATVAGAVLAAGFGWLWWEALITGAGCGVAAAALLLPVALRRPAAPGAGRSSAPVPGVPLRPGPSGPAPR